jgi:HD-GYP domain-containing protein (c-di-GMP phosphodiesterase class II)
MKRITIKYAKPGMVVDLPVFDNFGNQMMHQHKQLDKNDISKMAEKGVQEIFIRDFRVSDVLVAPLFNPQSEGILARVFRQLVENNIKGGGITKDYITQVLQALNQMIRDMALNVLGDVNVSCCISPQDYVYLQPVKTAGLAMAIGNNLKLPANELVTIGLAAVLKDIGLPLDIIKSVNSLMEGGSPRMRGHPVAGYKLLTQNKLVSNEVAEAILQHHEFWSGSGYPQGLKGKEISKYASIITIADAFVDLLAERPGGTKYMSHEAIEYIMAYSGDQFDPELVELFVRQVPSYLSGLGVELNTGETGVISNPKRGYVARPIVRICSLEGNTAIEEPYDIDLSLVKYQRKLITKVLEYD